MKIKKEHYAMLKAGMIEALNKLKNKNINSIRELIEYYQKNNIGRIHKDRACYDLLRGSIIDGLSSTRFICDVLYTYLDDTHLRTALNKIMQEI